MWVAVRRRSRSRFLIGVAPWPPALEDTLSTENVIALAERACYPSIAAPSAANRGVAGEAATMATSVRASRSPHARIHAPAQRWRPLRCRGGI